MPIQREHLQFAMKSEESWRDSANESIIIPNGIMKMGTEEDGRFCFYTAKVKSREVIAGETNKQKNSF